jgi:hypothetical protein
MSIAEISNAQKHALTNDFYGFSAFYILEIVKDGVNARGFYK